MSGWVVGKGWVGQGRRIHRVRYHRETGRMQALCGARSCCADKNGYDYDGAAASAWDPGAPAVTCKRCITQPAPTESKEP